MEELNHCLICRKSLISKHKESERMLFLVAGDALVSKKKFKIEACPFCGFLFTNPRPTQNEIKAYYHSEAYISHTEKKQSLRDRLYFYVQKIMLAKKFRLLNKHTNPKQRKLLDYGCGSGTFLKESVIRGYDSVGYEPEQIARKKAQAKGLLVADRNEKVLGIDTQAYDIISLWHVLEHLHEFPSILNDFYTKLSPDGILLIAVPMAESADAVYYKNNWAGWDLPRHLFHFTRESLVKSCNQAGFKLIQNKGMPFDSYYVSWLSEQQINNPIAPIKAFLIGTWSNVKAIIGKTPWSSEIFVFRKTGRG